jgi:hypothetical protein
VKTDAVEWYSQSDWSRFTAIPITEPTNVPALSIVGGNGLIEGGALGTGNDRRVYVLGNFFACDVEAQLDFRLLHDGTGPAQIGLFIFRNGLPIVVWTNIFFAADARLLLGAWEYDGNLFLNTHQDAWTHDIEGATFSDPARLRSLKVRVEGSRLRIKQWYQDTAQPDWAYDAGYPAAAGTTGTFAVGMLVAHTGAGKSNIIVENLSLLSLDTDAEWRSTDLFIRDNPFDVVLTRYRTVDTPAGGTKKVALGPLSPQLARLVESGLQGASATRHLPDGRTVNVSATLVLHVGADVKSGDTFHYKGEDWECGEISGRWATRAEVFRYGVQ